MRKLLFIGSLFLLTACQNQNADTIRKGMESDKLKVAYFVDGEYSALQPYVSLSMSQMGYSSKNTEIWWEKCSDVCDEKVSEFEQAYGDVMIGIGKQSNEALVNSQNANQIPLALTFGDAPLQTQPNWEQLISFFEETMSEKKIVFFIQTELYEEHAEKIAEWEHEQVQVVLMSDEIQNQKETMEADVYLMLERVNQGLDTKYNCFILDENNEKILLLSYQCDKEVIAKRIVEKTVALLQATQQVAEDEMIVQEMMLYPKGLDYLAIEVPADFQAVVQ